MGKIYYLMGKSASGKDHIYEHLIQETALDLKPFVLYTTRPIRSGEQDGREYFFVDEKRLSGTAGGRKDYRGAHVSDACMGPWYYFTADDGQIDLAKQDYLGIGTLESYREIRGTTLGSRPWYRCMWKWMMDCACPGRWNARENRQSQNTPKCAADSWQTAKILPRRNIAKAGIVRRFFE